MPLSQKELDELNGGEVSPEALAELNQPTTTDVGPFASEYKLPEAPPPVSLRDEVATRMSRRALERQRERETTGDLAGAVASRLGHNLTAGHADEAVGLGGGILSGVRAAARNMANPDPTAAYDEFGIPLGGTASAEVAGGYTGARDEKRADEKRLAAGHPIATALTDVGTALAPGSTARLAAQGEGDSEATKGADLLKDSAVGIGAAAATKLGGWGAQKVASKLGQTVAAKVAAKAAPELTDAEKAAAALRGTGRYPGLELPKAPKAARPPTTVGKTVRDLAIAVGADYAAAHFAKELGLPMGLATAIVATRKASSAGTSNAVAGLVAKAHEAGLDTAAAKLIAQQLPQAAAAAFLDRFVTHEDAK